MAKRIFDILFSIIALILLSPILLIIAICIKVGSRGTIFYMQERVGKRGKSFRIWKFRTMNPNSDKLGLITVGGRDPRITGIGYWLRKYKLDELPQFINVLIGSMSIVGPRPEVRKYVEMYSLEQQMVLSVKPGITDYASLLYKDENEILGRYPDADKAYIEIVMPHKLKLNLEYVKNNSFVMDIKIILLTIKGILH